jgi:hypothetical protein
MGLLDPEEDAILADFSSASLASFASLACC